MRRLALATALLACTITGSAQAATMVNRDGRLTYTARGPAPIDVDFYYGGTSDVYVTRQFADGDPVTVTGCTELPGSPTYSCPGVTAVAVVGGSADDSVRATGLDVPIAVEGGAGNDYLFGGTKADVLSGGPGDDVFYAATGDTVGGGAGIDAVTYVPPAGAVGAVSLTLDGVADDGVAGDGVNLLGDIEDVDADGRFDVGEPLPVYGPVTLVGTAAGNRLTGSSGPDTITGGDGVDFLEGGAGDDTLMARDGLADRVRCGPGADTAVVDPFDQVSDTCETVLAEGASPDDTPPRIAWRPGSPLGVTAEDDRGIASVQWLDADRVVCTDAAPPFDCDFAPAITEVGAHTLIAIATDTSGQTASITTTRTVDRVKPLAVTLKVKRSGRRSVASGAVKLPAGVACSGTVEVGSRTAKLVRNCSFRVAVSRAKRYVAQYLGTDTIAPLSSKAVRPRR
jgi:hypothetical protein